MGLILAFFMIVYMFLVLSILISDEVMYKVVKFFEGSLFLKVGELVIVSVVAVGIIFILVVYVFLVLRKFFINYR